jgi:hypothetical protein
LLICRFGSFAIAAKLPLGFQVIGQTMLKQIDYPRVDKLGIRQIINHRGQLGNKMVMLALKCLSIGEFDLPHENPLVFKMKLKKLFHFNQNLPNSLNVSLLFAILLFEQIDHLDDILMLGIDVFVPGCKHVVRPFDVHGVGFTSAEGGRKPLPGFLGQKDPTEGQGKKGKAREEPKTKKERKPSISMRERG